ncbi:MAG TPA: TolC family protein [Methylomirabilota bacterium]|jgi:outer membrane protein|nr:TolC family protein [Methylomirabilota bacterium]
MRIAQGSVALVLCLLASAVPGRAQTPTPAPTTPAPATPAPAPTPATPPATTGSTPAAPIPGNAAAAARVIGHALTQEEAIGIALETQPSIQARLSDYMAAAHRVDQALSPLLPQLIASGTATRSQSALVTNRPPADRRGTPDPRGQATVTRLTDFSEDTTVGVTLSQVLFDFGKTFASTEAARRLAEQAQEDVELQRQLVTLTVKESFININFARRLIRVQEQALERADLNLRSARGFFEVGTRPKSDVARAEVDVANARVDLIRARNAERLARVALNTAMGIAADTATEVQDNLVFQAMALDRTQLQSQALAQRPEYKQARLKVSEFDARMRRAFRDFFPDVSASGFYGGTRADLNEIWEIGLTLSWSIFDGGNKIARLREAKANVDASIARVKSTELDISRDVEQAQLNVSEAQERIGAAQTAVASAQENFRLAQGRFDAGVGTILELTDAQLFLTQAQNTEAQALADYRIAVARLERAIGRR